MLVSRARGDVPAAAALAVPVPVSVSVGVPGAAMHGKLAIEAAVAGAVVQASVVAVVGNIGCISRTALAKFVDRRKEDERGEDSKQRDDDDVSCVYRTVRKVVSARERDIAVDRL